MTKYAALLRGITPSNPNMHNAKLREVFINLGLNNVMTVISSGNVLFETDSNPRIEDTIEKALEDELKTKITVIVRSKDQLSQLVASSPFDGFTDSPISRLNVTFLKHPHTLNLQNNSLQVGNNSYEIVKLYQREVCTTIDLSSAKTPDMMSWLEKNFGKAITTRTWKTVHRILAKF